MEMITVTAKTVEDAITQASVQLGVSSDRLQYEVVEKPEEQKVEPDYQLNESKRVSGSLGKLLDALFCYAGFLRLYRLSFAEVLNEKVQFVKEKSGFPDGLPGREVLRKQISGHVRDGFGTGGHENRNFRQQKGRKQRCKASVRETCPRKLPVK